MAGNQKVVSPEKRKTKARKASDWVGTLKPAGQKMYEFLEAEENRDLSQQKKKDGK